MDSRPDSLGSAVGVARAPAVATERGPFFQRRAVRTEDLDHGAPCRAPSSSLRRRTTVGASSRSWVAQAVESVRTTSRPSAKLSGRAVRGDLRADELGPPAEDPVHREIELPAVVGDQPADAWRRTAAGRGRRGARRDPAAGAGAAVRLALPRARRRASTAPSARVERRCARSSPSSRRRRPRAPAGGPGRRARHGHGSPRPSATSKRAPASAAGTSARDGGGDQHLLGAGDQVGQLGRRSVSSSANTSSRIRIGSSPSARSRS